MVLYFNKKYSCYFNGEFSLLFILIVLVELIPKNSSRILIPVSVSFLLAREVYEASCPISLSPPGPIPPLVSRASGGVFLDLI